MGDSNELTQLQQLKVLLDIPEDDTSEDSALQLKLDGALELCEEWFRQYAEKPLEVGSDGKPIIPTSVLIGISKYIEAVDTSAGVKSESIGGMSVSYGGGTGINSTGSPLDDFYAFLEPYRCRKITFIPMRKNAKRVF